MTKMNHTQSMELLLNRDSLSLSEIRNKLVTYNMMRRNRWQIVSDDHVWFYPADISLSTVELDSQVYKDTPYESCIFYANGDSELLRRYKTQAEAISGHVELEQKYNLKRISRNEFKI